MYEKFPTEIWTIATTSCERRWSKTNTNKACKYCELENGEGKKPVRGGKDLSPGFITNQNYKVNISSEDK